MNIIKKLILITILSSFIISTQYVDAFEQMKTYTVADGLVGPVVPVIFQDSSGMLWFGSDRGGVSRFDGDTFIKYSGDSKVFRGITKKIVEDKWGHIWFLSKHPSEGDGVISRYDGENFSYINDGNCLAVDNAGDVWIGGNNTIIRYTALNSQEVPQPYPISITATSVARINVIFQSNDDTYWLGGNDAQGVLLISFQQDSNMWQVGTLRRHENLPNISKDRSVHVIMQDAENNLWFGGRSLLLKYDGTQFEEILNTSIDSTKQSGTLQNTLTLQNQKVSVKSDSHGRIWFSDDQQLSWWDGENLQRLRSFSVEANPNYFLYGSYEIEDAWNKLWFASRSGAHLYDNKYFEENTAGVLQLDSPLTDSPEFAPKVYGVDDGLGSDNILTVFEGLDGKIWFGHDNGVTSFEPQPVIVNHSTRATLGSNSVRLMFSDSDETLWLSIPGGVATYNADEERLIQYPLVEHTTKHIILGNDDNITEQIYNRRIDITKLFEADGYIWFIDKPFQIQNQFTHYRIYRFKNGEFEDLSLIIQPEIGPGGEPLFHDSPPIVSLGKDPWISLGGWLFLPRSNGLYRFTSRETFELIRFLTIQSLPQPSEVITAIHTDTHNRLWCYYDTGEVKRYSNIKISPGQLSGTIHTELLPLQSVIPIAVTSDEQDVQWFYNTSSGQLMYWDDPEIADTLTELPGSASGAPLLTIQTNKTIDSNSTAMEAPQDNSNDDSETTEQELMTFVFRDSIKTYAGTELKKANTVEVIDVRGHQITTNGDLWLATAQGAILYDYDTVTTYTTADGFLVDDLRDVHEDHWGNLWFATWGGGVVRYDGNSFQSISTKDGLIHNNVSSIHATNEEDLWFGSEGGATQYRASLGVLPFCRITSVDAGKIFTEPFLEDTGKRSFSEITELLPARIKNVTINFEGINPLRDDLEYKFRLFGVENNKWTTVSSNIKQPNETLLKGDVKQTFLPEILGENKLPPRIQYEGLKSGSYTFLIKAFREGWPYTQQPTVLNFTIDQPIWSRWRNYLPTLIFIAAVGSLVFRLVVNRRHTAQLRIEMREKEEAEMQRIRAEINEAQNIQMGLLPDESPDTQTFDIAGMSIPATQVGGDFYDYFTVENGNTAIAVADAAGKGIRGAMNAVLTNGMLNEVARFVSEADVILRNLNAGLAPRMYGPSFIAVNLAVLDENKKQIDYANGGQPYPLLKRGSEIIEIENTDLPLGSRKNVQYESTIIDLEEGDIFIFHTDGLIEALNASHDMYGSDRFNELAARIPDESTAEEVIQYIVDDVQDFVQDEEQYDDMTLVVVKLNATSTD